MSNNNFPRGAEWRKWDLHVHTPASILNNGFDRNDDGPDWDSYVEHLEKSESAVIGVTDYFTIDGYKELLARQAAGRLKGVTLLPNIEFRLDKTVSARSDGKEPRRLNLHVIFSDEVTAEDIESHFLHDLNFTYEEAPADPGSRWALKPANLTLCGERLKKEHKHFNEIGMSALQIGAMTAVVSLDQIKELLQKDAARFKNKYLLVLAAENWDQIPWDGQDHLVRKNLLRGSHAVFASAAKTISWCLGRPPYKTEVDEEAFLAEFASLKPCIWGSDAHDNRSIGRPCAKRGAAGHKCEEPFTECEFRYCWIKADPTFEGLRQVLYEPADRVKIQAVSPAGQKSIFTIESIRFPETKINSELTISETVIQLNPNLVTVTGGKGSGKTAIVDLLAHCFSDRRKSRDTNSFVKRIAEDAPDMALTIGFANGESFTKTVGDSAVFEQGPVSYIAQGELERYIDEHSDLNEYIHAVVFESPRIKDTVKAFEYESQAARVGGIEKDLAAKNKLISQLEEGSDPTKLAASDRSGKQARAELDDTTKRIAALEKQLSKENIAANTSRQEAISKLKTSRDHLLSVRDRIAEILRVLDSEFDRFGQLVTTLNSLVALLSLGGPVSIPAYPDRERLVQIDAAAQQQLKGIVQQIEEQERLIQSVDAELTQHRQLLGKKQELEGRVNKLKLEHASLEAMALQLISEKAKRAELIRSCIGDVDSQRQRYGEVIALFGNAKEKILKDLDFTAAVTHRPEVLIKNVADLVDQREVQVRRGDKMPSVCDPLIEKLAAFAAGKGTSADDIVNEIERLREELGPKLKGSFTLAALDSALYRNHFVVEPATTYKGTSLSRLSLGQKATVLIKIYLAAGDRPIIIDSHDDHLDNEYIMQELVGAIRQAKEHRQVILASNNGNVVMNSDAEQVVLATRRDATISYDSGSLEEPRIREVALKVLEGGEPAFKRRQEKYRMAG